MSDSESLHFRKVSNSTSSTSSSTGASYQLILEHILSYPGTYEIPLRTMYTLNCASRAQFATPDSSPTASSSSESVDIQSANAQLTASLLAQISQQPAQPASLPPSFITMFVKRCFTPEVHWVDFPQSLTALDYIKDLEARRRKEVSSSLARLGVARERVSADAEAMRGKFPGAAMWVKELEGKEKRADALYTQLYIALRRWILINEMSLQPFNKHNCIAMLNTLYPPVAKDVPAAKLTPMILQKQRDGFFRYIKAVETRGIGVLRTLQNQGKAETEANGWPDVHRNLEKYLRLANTTINECADVTDVTYFQPTAPTRPLPNIPVHVNKTPKKLAKKPSTGVSPGSSPPRPPSDGMLSQDTAPSRSSFDTTPRTPHRRTAISTLERIAREINRLRKGRPELEEITDLPPTLTREKQKKAKEPKTPRLRKMRSLGVLSELKQGGNNASTASVAPRFGTVGTGGGRTTFDREALKQERLAYESRAGLDRSRLGYDT